MKSKVPSIATSILSAVLLIAISLFMGLMLLVMLNGLSENDGLPALIAFAIFHLIIIILGTIFASRFTAFLMNKYNWHPFWAGSVSIIVVIVLGIIFSFVAWLISIMTAGALRNL